MIILPDRAMSSSKFLLPMRKTDWMPTSEYIEKDCFGKDSKKTFFKVTMKVHQKTIWKGLFDDRDDFDAFLFGIACGSIKYDKYLWRLPTPELNPDVLDVEDVAVLYAVQSTYSSFSGTTVNKPIDWNPGNNMIECLGSGGQGGGCSSTSGNAGGGGGGGSFSRTVNTNGLNSVSTYYVASVAPISNALPGANPGSNGTAAQLKSENSSGTILCYAAPGSGGPGGSGSGGAGGTTANNVYTGTGSIAYSGGNGGLGSWTTASVKGAGGGGGAAGRNGNGGNEPGDGGGGAAGYGVDNNGNGAQTLGAPADTNGYSGNEYGGGYGHGSGCGRKTSGSSSLTTGNYGAGGGGARSTGIAMTGGSGAYGLVVVTYSPLVLTPTNSPMMGL